MSRLDRAVAARQYRTVRLDLPDYLLNRIPHLRLGSQAAISGIPGISGDTILISHDARFSGRPAFRMVRSRPVIFSIKSTNCRCSRADPYVGILAEKKEGRVLNFGDVKIQDLTLPDSRAESRSGVGGKHPRPRLECFGQAKDDFERYLQLAPDAEDAAAIREQLVELAKRVVLIH